jgi:hypothetical protein
VTQAIFGLLGVLIGGLIAAGAPFVLARRTERVKARASARLLEDELRTMRSSLHRHAEVVADELREKSPESARLKAAREDLRRSLTLDSWHEHRPLLAETLDTNDWYDLASAYRWVEDTQRIFEERAAVGARAGAEVRVPKIVDVAMTHEMHLLDAGIRALERLAGRPRSQLEPNPLPDFFLPEGHPTSRGRLAKKRPGRPGPKRE